MDQIIECVPNFSEGRDTNFIKQISGAIERVEGIKLLGVDPGKATNRTVITFVGHPEQVVEAAFQAVRMASELIDMSLQQGEHPRFGATDVCPLIPVSGITMEETIMYARNLAERIGNELSIPVYCYERAALIPSRRNLAEVRSGEYEGLKHKLSQPEWKPDYGPSRFNKRSGAIAVGARDFLIAYNINLNTTSIRRANAIAFDVREKGRVLREGNPITGKIVRDDKGSPVYIPGTLKAVKAIGWYIEEYGIAQISMNLTDISVTPIHQAFDETCRKADARGIRVTGSELIGLVPLHAMLEAGRYFLKKQKRSAGVSNDELIKIAVKSLGLSDLYPFNPNEKIIEYKMKDHSQYILGNMTMRDFIHETASESPAPGGGSVSAYVGSLGIALGTMVANLSAHKRGWDERWEEFSNWAEKGKTLQEELLLLMEEDTIAFKEILKASKLPKITVEEKKIRSEEIEAATLKGIEIPYRVMQTAIKGFEIVRAMADTGIPNSISDAGVGAIALRSSILGAWINVQINAASLENKELCNEILKDGKKLTVLAQKMEEEILTLVLKKIQV